jgi:hypothetical protein
MGITNPGIQEALILLDWIGLDWIGLDWIGLDWIGLDWIGLDWIGLDWIIYSEKVRKAHFLLLFVSRISSHLIVLRPISCRIIAGILTRTKCA